MTTHLHDDLLFTAKKVMLGLDILLISKGLNLYLIICFIIIFIYFYLIQDFLLKDLIKAFQICNICFIRIYNFCLIQDLYFFT